MKWIEQNPKWSRLQRDLVFDRLWKGGAKIFTLVCEILPFKNEIDDYLEKVSIRDEILLKLLVHLPTVSGSDCLAYVIYVMPGMHYRECGTECVVRVLYLRKRKANDFFTSSRGLCKDDCLEELLTRTSLVDLLCFLGLEQKNRNWNLKKYWKNWVQSRAK